MYEYEVNNFNLTIAESLQQEIQILSMGDREDQMLLAVAGLKKVLLHIFTN